MSHSHSDRSQIAFQVFTLAVVAGIGLAGVLMYADGRLGYILARQFHLPVLLGGIGLLAVVALRAISLRSVVHECDPSWQSSRLIVLSFPIGLFLLGLPNSGFSQDRIRQMLGGDDAMTINEVIPSNRDGTVSSFRELHAAAGDRELQERLTGQTAVLEGRLNQIEPRRFTLFRLRMTCCAADVVPVKIRVVLKGCTLDGFKEFDWVRMKGRIQFVETPNSERMTPVIVVEDSADIRRTATGNEYDD